MAEANGSQAPKKATHRSPNYPAFDLGAALEKVRSVYDKDKRTPTTPEVIVSHLGYKHTDGPGGRSISCLRQYGLLEQAGGNWKVSDAAFNLLHLPDSDPQRATLLREAARTPNLYRQLFDEYPEDLPSDPTLKSNLLRRGFNPDALDAVIADLRSTAAFAKVYDVSHTEAKELSKVETPTPVTSQPQPRSQSRNAVDSKVYVFAFAGEGQAEFVVSGEYTEEDLTDLEALLKTTLNGLRRSIKKTKEHVQ